MKPQVRPPDPDNGTYILGCNDPENLMQAPRMGLAGVHLFAGGSGSGKTTLLFQMIKAMQSGAKFFGHPTQNHKLVYTSLDRTELETEFTADRVGVDPKSVPHYRFGMEAANPNDGDYRLERLILGALELHPDLKILVVDGITLFAMHGKINDYQAMALWYQRVGDFCRKHGICLIGITHSPKSRAGQEITDARQMAIGSVATPGSVGTLLVIESKSDSLWKLHFLSRDLPDECITVTKDDVRGTLIEVPANMSNNEISVISMAAKWALGAAQPAGDVIKALRASGLSRATCYRTLDSLVAKGTIYKPKHGFYARTPVEERVDAAEHNRAEQAGELVPFETGSFMA